MAHYNHFGKNKYTSILFSKLKNGDVFGKTGNTCSTCIKTGPLHYLIRKTGVEMILFSNEFFVYIKQNNRITEP